MLQASPLGETPKAVPRSTRRLRATPRPDHRLRRWPLENSAGLHGPSSSEQGTAPSRRLLPQDDEGDGSPSLASSSEHPWMSSVLRAVGWMFPPCS
jgi:hypothetical protein